MKKVILTGLLMSYILSAYAQRGDFRNMSVEERTKFQTDRMVTDLELDSAIIEQVYEVNFKYAKQMEEGRTEDMSRMDIMKLMEKTNKARNKEFKVILTKDQYKNYMRQQQERSERMQQRMKTGGG